MKASYASYLSANKLEKITNKHAPQPFKYKKNNPKTKKNRWQKDTKKKGLCILTKLQTTKISFLNKQITKTLTAVDL